MLKHQNGQLSSRSGSAGRGWAVYGTTSRLNNHVVILCLFGLLIQVCRAQDCGSQANNAVCRDGLCCSQFGFCGVGSEYCGNGCQSNCNSTEATDPEQICGTAVNNTLCPNNECCSEFGYCGSTSIYCGAGCQSGPCDPAAGGDSGLKVWAKVVIAVAAVVAALILGAVIFCCIKRRSRKPLLTKSRDLTLSSSTGGQSFDSFHHHAGMTYIFSDNQKILGMRFTYEYLNAATNGFSKELGRGAFGVVYKGLLKDDTEVAVKSVLNNHRGLKDFEAEIKTLGSINHANLVALRGFCFEPDKPPYIVYEFAQNGSLDRWIFTTDKKVSLPWKVRMSIARGTAKGLAYLHEDLQIGQAIIHLDIKPENILLDENFTPKVADFGLAKLIGEKIALTLASGGTLGYMAPETYAGAASTKMDVYSFGIVLLELVCGRRQLNFSLLPNEEFYLPSWALRKVSANEETDILDPKLYGIFDATEARRLIIVALLCLRRDPDLRCDMGTVWRTLEGLTSVPAIPEDLKTDLEMVERLLRRSSADNSVYSSDTRSTAASVFSLSSTGGANSNSLSTSSSYSEPLKHASEKTVQPNMVPETTVDIPSETEPGAQQYQKVETPRRSTSGFEHWSSNNER